MKKLNKVLAGVLVSSMIFGICSCASDKTSKSDSDDNETVASEVEEDDTAADETTEDETEVTETVNEHYAENVEKFLEAIKEADDVDEVIFECMSFYKDGITGDMTINKEGDIVTFWYNNGENVALYLDWDTTSASENMVLTYSLRYDGVDGEYAVFYDDDAVIKSSEIEDIIWSVDGSEEAFWTSGSPAGEIDIQSDSKILYARAITLLESTFDELGFGFEDFGFDFGSKYKDIDVTAKLCDEYIPKFTDHVFEDAVCKDCGKDWITCLDEGIDIYHNGSQRGFPSNPIEDEIGGTTSFYTDPYQIALRWWTFPSANRPDDPNAEFFFYFYPSDPGKISLTFSYGGEMVPVEDEEGVVRLVGQTRVSVAMDMERMDNFIKNHDTTDAVVVVYANDTYSSTVPDEFWEHFDEYVPSIIRIVEMDLNILHMSLTDIGINPEEY